MVSPGVSFHQVHGEGWTVAGSSLHLPGLPELHIAPSVLATLYPPTP